MKHNNCKKLLTFVMALVLMAAMALTFTGCSSNESTTPAETTTAVETTAAVGELTTFTVIVTDLEGNEDSFDITTSKAMLGEALLDEGLIAGEEGDYGLFITSVNGIAADWDNDQTYWAFYIDGEYALTGVDATEITAGATYALVLTKG